ncbi:hypothetical protein BN1221_04561 [Brenneria goodwinii]|uniref:Uncharacterized protein n=1 Tax=Brenneria goodwinii TaxID=1109412 RepID=A0A0G4K1U7_9GAMM|nr:hypothetical protein BN1221_04561 [Brenneria goodwinii]
MYQSHPKEDPQSILYINVIGSLVAIRHRYALLVNVKPGKSDLSVA